MSLGTQRSGINQTNGHSDSLTVKFKPRPAPALEPLQVSIQGTTALTSLSLRTTYELIANNKFPMHSMKVGKRKYWTVASIKRWVEAGGEY
jgi:predicted DNA-binding transcriptional regulator AlpA